jgi:hypothetical protein
MPTYQNDPVKSQTDTNSPAVIATSTTTNALLAESSGGNGVIGTSTTWVGVQGETFGTENGPAGVWGDGHEGGSGVKGQTSCPGAYGVAGVHLTNQGPGIFGLGSPGISGLDESGDVNGYGVYGSSTTGSGVYGTSPDGTGVTGTSTSNTGVAGTSTRATGVFGISTAAVGVVGITYGEIGLGVAGVAYPGSTAVYAYGDGIRSRGIYTEATGPDSLALLAAGDATVAGTLSKGGGSFRIDHPLDPANKYLYHSFVESPDMMNVYNGNVTLGSDGRATVELPDWFEALNRDFRYQLTSIGSLDPTCISRKVSDGSFEIMGSPQQEVSWQVTGIRQDAWANAHRVPLEVEKKPADRGRYLHPDLFGGEPIEEIARGRRHRQRLPNRPQSA